MIQPCGSQQFRWEINLAAPPVQWQKQQQSRDRLRYTRMACRRCRLLGMGRIENEARELDQRRGSLARIALKRGTAFHRIVVEIEDAGIDHVLQHGNRQLVSLDARKQRFGQGITLAARAARIAKNVTPPLKTDFSRQRLAGDVPDAGDLRVEGIESRQRAALVRRRQQAGKVTIAVAVAQRRHAEIVGSRGGRT